MGPKAKLMLTAVVAVACAAICTAKPPPGEDREAIIEVLLRRDRSLRGVHFQVPVGVYRRYLEHLHAPLSPPTAFLPEAGTYRLHAGRRQVTLHAKLQLRVLDAACPAIGVLADLEQGWQEVTINGQPAYLPAVDGFLRFLPPDPGHYVITAKAPLGRPSRRGGSIRLAVLETARTMVVFDSPTAWEVTVNPGEQPLLSSSGAGTHGRLALPPVKTPLAVTYRPPALQTERAQRFELSGQVAWNLDAASQQITAALSVTIAGRPADRLELLLPPAADRLEITGPDVAQITAQPGRTVVHFHGKIQGRTALRVAYEMPRSGAVATFGSLGVAGGHWTDGTVAVSNTAGGSEIVPAGATGLEEMALADLPSSARAILPAPAVLAYRITARRFALSVDVLELGEFALRQSIADLAHYEVFCTPDGAMLGRARYEIRNHTGQFLTLVLPGKTELLLARVNDQPCPVSPGAAGGSWLLPLERSRASVMGLVSFPVEVVYLGRLAPPAQAREIEIPLPQIDLPIAYGWCQAYLPEGLMAEEWTGPMKHVRRLSSETARASLDYGRAELARKPSDAGKAPVAAARVILARNYYRTGTEAYDRGDYAAAEEMLGQVVQLAPQSVEAANAERLLANWNMLRGQLAPRSATEKAAAAQVQREVAEGSRALSEAQADILAQVTEAARAGKVQEAATKLKVAELLQEELAQRGASKKELAARSRQVQQEAKDIQEALHAKSSALREQMSQLREAGQFDTALEVGWLLRDLEGESPELRAQMEELAIASSRKQALRSGYEQQPGVPMLPPAAEPVVREEFDVRDLLAASRPAGRDQPAEEDRLLGLIRQNVDPQSWQVEGRELRIVDGVLAARTTAANRQAVAELLDRLRRARGPAVAIGGRIAVQRAKGLGDVIAAPTPPAADSKELRQFLAQNYDWQLSGAAPQAALQPSSRPATGAAAVALDVSGLIQRLEQNLGQKVTVDSFNVRVDAAAAEALGVSFRRGRNDLSWAVIDEAQARSLLELAEARATGSKQAAFSPTRRQETIVGTDALLANAMTANAAFASDRDNTLNVADNPIALPHDRYLVIDSGSQLTVVRTGEMQHWTQSPETPEPLPAPQSIEVPRVGQLVQFEKTLLDPADRLVLRAETSWKGMAP